MKVANQQKNHCDKKSTAPLFTAHDKVWLSVPTAGKLQPRWEGGWRVTEVKSPVTIQINNGRKSKMVHSSRLRHRFQAAANSSESMVTANTEPSWTLPLVEHYFEAVFLHETGNHHSFIDRKHEDKLRVKGAYVHRIFRVVVS